ncbi:hypothetical protein G7079_08795 [Thermomonas sp. HDW16]|nr:hypothetical protein G7079_08795 [Thermomonas sp. HDW16]
MVTMGHGRGSNHLRPLLWGAAACLLLLPAMAMQFFPASGVNWSTFDFIVMGAMLAIACGLYEFGAWLSGSTAYRVGFGLAVVAAFLTVWVNLAVGMLGNEHDIVNLMFAGVLFVAAAGALLAALKPGGMAWTMLATAAAQLLAVGVGLAMREFEPRELVLGAMFALPWLASAALFRRAARQQASDGAKA